MSKKKKNPTIFSTLQKTTQNASVVNGEMIHQLPVTLLEDNPMNCFSMEEDEEFQATVSSVEVDGFLDDIIVTPSGPNRWRIVSGHRRVAAAKKLGKRTVPCKIRRYPNALAELRTLMGANLCRRNITPFEMARQLDTLRNILEKEGMLPENVKDQAELMAKQTKLSRATVERYLSLLRLDDVLTEWASSGKMTMTDAYELAREKNHGLFPVVEQYVAQHNHGGDFSELVHRAVVCATTEMDPPKQAEKHVADPMRAVDSFGRSIRRSTAKLKELDFSSEEDQASARRKLDTCLENLEELCRTVQSLREYLNE